MSSSININSSSSAAAYANSSPVVTAAQDQINGRIASLQAQRAADANNRDQAQAAANATENWYNGLSAKDQKKPENIARRNIAQQNAQAAQSKLDADDAQLKALNAQLPGAILADKAATQANENKEKAAEDSDDRRTEAAQHEKQESQANAAEKNSEASKSAPTAKGKASNPANVVGLAAGGSAPASEELALAPAAEPGAEATPQAHDGYTAPAPSPKGDKLFTSNTGGGSNSVLTDEERAGTDSRAQGRGQSSSSKAVVTGQGATTASVGDTGAGKEAAADAASQASKDVTTDSGLSYLSLPQSVRDLVDDTKKKTLAAAREGRVKDVEDAFKKGFEAIAQQSASADEPAADEKPKKKGSGAKATAGAAGKSLMAVDVKGGTTTTVGGAGGAGADATAAGNIGLSSQVGATGATGSAVQKTAVAGLTGSSPQKSVGGSGANVTNQIGGAIGRAFSSAVGATGVTAADQAALQAPSTEVGKAYSGGMSPMELVQMVMLQAFQEAGEDVKNAAELMKKQTDAKATARDSENGLRTLVQYDSMGKLSTSVADGQSISAKSASDMLSSIDGNIDAIGDDNQVLMIRLQNLTQLMTTMSQAASNMSKSAYDTTKSVIGQIGH